MFHKLWLPPKTDSLILNSISLNGTSLNSTVKYTLYKESNNIPLNKNYLKTCYQLLHSSQQNIMKNVDTPLNKDTFTGLKNKCSSDLIRTRKIRIFPNEEHINFYKSCFGASRFLYNRLIYSFKKESNDYLDSLKKSAKKKGCIKVVKMKSESLNNKSRTSGSKTTKKPLIVKCCKKVKGDYFCKDHIESKIPYKINTSFIYWRNKLILKKSNLPEEDLWLGNIPYDTRQLVIKNAMGGIKSALTKVKKGDIKGFDLKYKRKKNINSEIFNVDHRALIYKEHKNGFFLFPSQLKTPIKLRKGENKWLKKYFLDLKKEGKKLCDMTIIKEKGNRYFLQIPYETPIVNDNKEDSVVSVDPGIITFGAFYDPSGKCGKLGDNLGKVVGILNDDISKLTSKISNTVNHKKNIQIKKIKNKIITKKYDNKDKLIKKIKILEKTPTNDKKDRIIKKNKIKRLKNKILKEETRGIIKQTLLENVKKQIKQKKKMVINKRKKVKNVVKDTHQKIISYLCKNYKYIIVPKLNTVSISKKQKKQGNQREAQKTMTISEGLFMARLKTKIESYKEKYLIVPEESYTSMTCGKCGKLNKKLGRKRKFNCEECKSDHDRDINAARNILIKTLMNAK